MLVIQALLFAAFISCSAPTSISILESIIQDAFLGNELATNITTEQQPTIEPTQNPTTPISLTPTHNPTYEVTELPTLVPTNQQSDPPTFIPSSPPSALPSFQPTFTSIPTELPTVEPSSEITDQPTPIPTLSPTEYPSSLSTWKPTTTSPSLSMSRAPTLSPTEYPTQLPSSSPSSSGSIQYPSIYPTLEPTFSSSLPPSRNPTFHVTELAPTELPSEHFTLRSADPTLQPTFHPFGIDSRHPTLNPTDIPSLNPTTVRPTTMPTPYPTDQQVDVPTVLPTEFPSTTLRFWPTSTPTYSDHPDQHSPSLAPSISPSATPTVGSSSVPSTVTPTAPTVSPSPSEAPTVIAQSISFEVAQILSGISAGSYNSKFSANNVVIAASVVAISSAVSPKDITFDQAVQPATSYIPPQSSIAGVLAGIRMVSATDCLLTYTIAIPNTATAGYVNGEAAYTAISTQLTTAAEDGTFTIVLNANAAHLGVTDLASVTSGALTTSGYSAGPADVADDDNTGLSTGGLIGIICGVFGVAVVLYGSVYICRQYKLRVTANEQARAMSTMSQFSDFLGNNDKSTSAPPMANSSSSETGLTAASAISSSSPGRGNRKRGSKIDEDEFGTEMGTFSTVNPLSSKRNSLAGTSNPQRDTFFAPGAGGLDSRDTFANMDYAKRSTFAHNNYDVELG